jgi:hypothetical protein
MSNTSANSRSARSAGHACAVGAVVMIVLAATTLWVQTDTDIPTDQWSYPWWSQAAVLFYLLAAGGQALLAVGIVGLRRRAAVGASRAGNRGLAAAVTGTVLLVIGEFASIPIRHQLVDDGWPRVVEAGSERYSPRWGSWSPALPPCPPVSGETGAASRRSPSASGPWY